MSLSTYRLLLLLLYRLVKEKKSFTLNGIVSRYLHISNLMHHAYQPAPLMFLTQLVNQIGICSTCQIELAEDIGSSHCKAILLMHCLIEEDCKCAFVERAKIAQIRKLAEKKKSYAPKGFAKLGCMGFKRNI